MNRFTCDGTALMKDAARAHEEDMNTSPISPFVAGTVRVDATGGGLIVTRILKGKIQPVTVPEGFGL